MKKEVVAGQYVAVSTLELPAGTTREIWLEDVPFAVLLVKQVCTNDDGSTGVRYLVTSELTLNFDRITKLFQKRWGIEVYSVAQAERLAGEVADAHRDDATQPSVCQFVRLRQTGTTQDQDQTEPFHLEDQTLPSGFADRICRACQAQRSIWRLRNISRLMQEKEENGRHLGEDDNPLRIEFPRQFPQI